MGCTSQKYPANRKERADLRQKKGCWAIWGWPARGVVTYNKLYVAKDHRNRWEKRGASVERKWHLKWRELQDWTMGSYCMDPNVRPEFQVLCIICGARHCYTLGATNSDPYYWCTNSSEAHPAEHHQHNFRSAKTNDLSCQAQGSCNLIAVGRWTQNWSDI